jgi:hypothetical protein
MYAAIAAPQVDLPVRIIALNDVRTTPIPARGSAISRAGLALRALVALNPGDLMLLQFPIPVPKTRQCDYEPPVSTSAIIISSIFADELKELISLRQLTSNTVELQVLVDSGRGFHVFESECAFGQR